MIDPIISAQRTERPAAARALPARSRTAHTARPAHTAKIVTAGLSTTLVLGIVSYFGIASAQSSAAVSQGPSTITAAVPGPVPATPHGVATPYTPGRTPAVRTATPVVIQVAVPGVGQPATPQATPQAIPVAVPAAVPPPAAAPQPAAPPVVTSGTTSASH